MVFSIIAVIILILDQISKFLVINNMNPNDSIPIVQNVFHLTFVRNPGAAFGILPNQTLFFVIATVIVVTILLVVYWKIARNNKILTIALALQLGGALGNLIDRIRFSYVIDFFDFRVWPVFNVADVAIVIGVILLSWQLLVWPE